MKQNTRFRHESLQDRKSVERLLKALVNGIVSGKIVLEDADGTMVMEPEGLANLKISAVQDEDKNRIDLRLTWRIDRELKVSDEIRIKSK